MCLRAAGGLWRCLAWSGRVYGGDRGWRGDPTFVIDACLCGGERRGVHGGAGTAGEGDGVYPAEFGGDAPPGLTGALRSSASSGTSSMPPRRTHSGPARRPGDHPGNAGASG